MDMQEAYAKADLERMEREIARLKLQVFGLQRENQQLKDKVSELQAALQNRAN